MGKAVAHMEYSGSNYQTLTTPRAPKKNRKRKAFIVGGDIPGLAAAAFLIRDAGFKPENVTVLVDPAQRESGPANTGDADSGFITRGKQELEENFQTLWDLYSTIPSLEVNGSVQDEVEELNAADPNVAQRRFTHKGGRKVTKEDSLGLSGKALEDITALVLSLPEDLYDREIRKRVSKDFLDSKFWLHMRTTFGFEKWHSALELKLHLQRYVHLIPHFHDMSGWKTTRYSRYHSLVLPLETWLRSEGVNFKDVSVTDVAFNIDHMSEEKIATSLTYMDEGGKDKSKASPTTIELRRKDLLLVTLGSVTENASVGDHDTPAVERKDIDEGGSWALWRKIAVNDPSFGNPDNFCTRTGDTRWHSATLTATSEQVRERISEITGRTPSPGRTVSGGVVTAVDSPWLLSWSVPRQPHFPTQREDQTVIWVYGKSPDQKGSYVKKPRRECTDYEITKEWLYHLEKKKKKIDTIAAEEVIGRPVSMPFVTSPLLPRHGMDRPRIVPEGAVNFGFLGQFVETDRDAILSPEYSVRTAMEAAYSLASVNRKVPEVYNSTYDIRHLLRAAAALSDYKPYKVPKSLAKRLARTELGWMLAQFGLIESVEEMRRPVEAVAPINR